jgi:hypothetical protein
MLQGARISGRKAWNNLFALGSMKSAFFIFLFLLASPAHAANNAVNLACKSLCASESECVRRCVGQAELFELNADFINAVTEWTKKPDDRMRALRSGANIEILQICKTTGWSLDNMMICLRSYPTPEVIKACKRLSALQEEQVRCVRMGKVDAEVDACSKLFPGSDRRLLCLEKNITAEDTNECRTLGGDSYEKASCLDRSEAVRMGEARKVNLDHRVRAERANDRQLASFSY